MLMKHGCWYDFARRTRLSAVLGVMGPEALTAFKHAGLLG